MLGQWWLLQGPSKHHTTVRRGSGGSSQLSYCSEQGIPLLRRSWHKGRRTPWGWDRQPPQQALRLGSCPGLAVAVSLSWAL